MVSQKLDDMASEPDDCAGGKGLENKKRTLLLDGNDLTAGLLCFVLAYCHDDRAATLPLSGASFRHAWCCYVRGSFCTHGTSFPSIHPRRSGGGSPKPDRRRTRNQPPHRSNRWQCELAL